jgi:hypothetical protein
MRINVEVETKWRDAFGEIHIPETSHCPSQIKPICENILKMYVGLDGVCPTNYNTMTELDKMIMLDYWKNYDRMNYFIPECMDFDEWFLTKSTPSELLRRSREFLVQHHAVYPKQAVADHAYQAGQNFSRSVKR